MIEGRYYVLVEQKDGLEEQIEGQGDREINGRKKRQVINVDYMFFQI